MYKHLLLAFSAALILGACGKGLDTNLKKAEEAAQPSTDPDSGPAVTETADYYLVMNSFGRIGLATLNDSQYVVMADNENNYIHLAKFTNGALRRSFGTNGYLAINSPDSGLKLDFPIYSAFRMQSCNGKIYALAAGSASTNNLASLYAFTETTNGMTAQALDFSIINSNMDSFEDITSLQCVGDYLILWTLRNAAPAYQAIISIRTSDNKISFLKQANPFYRYAGVHLSAGHYFLTVLNPSNYQPSNVELTIDNSTNRITLGSYVDTSSLTNMFGLKFQIVSNATSTYLAGVGEDGVFRALKGTASEIHAALATNSYNSANLAEYAVSIPAGFQLYDSNFCVTDSGIWNLIYSSNKTDYSDFTTKFIVLDGQTSTMTPVSSINSGTPFTVDNTVFTGASGYVGTYRALATCSGNIIQQMYPDANSVLQYKKYTP